MSAPKKKATTDASKRPKLSAVTKSLLTPKSQFNLLNGEVNLVDIMKESLAVVASRRKNEPTSLRSLRDIRSLAVPVMHFYLQYLLGVSYIKSATMLEIIGGTGTGKTTLAFKLAGEVAVAGVPTYYQETESKIMEGDQISRILSPDAEIAGKIYNRAICVDEAHSLGESTQKLENWVYDLRGKGPGKKDKRIPDSTPCFLVIDSWSKLMSENEACGYQDYSDLMSDENKKKRKEVGEGSNQGHAKHAHGWCRRLPYFLHDNNALLLIVSHKNDRVDMSGGHGPKMSADTAELYDITKIGGKAINQNAAIQLVLKAGGQAKNGSGDQTGTMIKMRVHKNSYGPKGRVIEYELRDHYTEGSQESPVRLDEGMAKWFADAKILDTTVERKRYTCEALDVYNGDGIELSAAFHARPDLMKAVALQLNIRGYTDPVEIIEEQVEVQLEDEKKTNRRSKKAVALNEVQEEEVLIDPGITA